ncbi:hypothetical protein NUW54_g14210 [Trametes sanguinea]|uniref:Uncharacterized protein n=1 Tax=Trametes sanguinea TaxID=158606 RepID=A0ACC1MDP9_9APHY|nr:hypothetical protein NUW54_g14210 [Trametes sanguinea]
MATHSGQWSTERGGRSGPSRRDTRAERAGPPAPPSERPAHACQACTGVHRLEAGDASGRDAATVPGC